MGEGTCAVHEEFNKGLVLALKANADNLKEIKDEVRRGFDKLEKLFHGQVTTCKGDFVRLHNRIDSVEEELTAHKVKTSYYLGIGVAVLTLLNIAVGLWIKHSFELMLASKMAGGGQ